MHESHLMHLLYNLINYKEDIQVSVKL